MPKKTIVFDTELRRPGCVLIQAYLGGSLDVANQFPSETWLTAPTENMRRFEVDDEILPKLIKMAVAAEKSQRRKTSERRAR